jgi:hypothetical protein
MPLRTELRNCLRRSLPRCCPYRGLPIFRSSTLDLRFSWRPVAWPAWLFGVATRCPDKLAEAPDFILRENWVQAVLRVVGGGGAGLRCVESWECQA